ncbi:MAG: hypothetical protein JW809_07385 [Pirellulales bacterium]|nr:hypothetical protein [Pirellulales bacterium]
MASPFSIFRKHQKFMIATLCLLAMIAFVFLPMVVQSQQESQAAENPVVISTEKYGDLRESDVYALLVRRQRLFHCLSQAMFEAGATGPQAEAILSGLLGNQNEEAAVVSWLLALRAEEMGLVVDDQMISRLLYDLTDKRLVAQDFLNLYRRLEMSEKEVFDSLHDALLATNLQNMTYVGLTASTPAQRWEFYQRLNRKVNAEVLPVAVAGFTGEVPDPDDEELKAFFEKYKSDFAVPGSPEPGFHVPKRVAFEYVKADYKKFADLEAVTREEIEEYYKEHREDYQNISLPGLDFDLPALPPTTTPLEPAEPKTENPDVSAPEKATPETAEPTPGDTSSAAGPTLRLVSFQEPEAKSDEATPAQPTDEAKGDEKDEASKGETTPAAEETKAAEAPKEDAKSEPPIQLPGPLPELPGEAPGTPTVPPAAPAAAPSAPSAPAAPDAPKPKYKPLEEVEGEIRQILAGRKATERILSAIGPIESKMREFRSARIRHEFDKAEGKDVKLPPLDLASLAAAAGMTFHRVDLLDAEQVWETDIGKSLILEFPADEPTGRVGRSFLETTFEGMPEFQPRISRDAQDNLYLFWMTQRADERIPEFTDEGVREQVLAAWRMVQARKLAVQRAEELAEKARKSGQSLLTALGGQKGVEVFQTGPFTWMTTGTVPLAQSRALPRISRVEHVEMAGRDFMRAVYDLNVGGIGVALNAPRTVAYVIRLTETTPDEKVLLQGFKAEDPSRYDTVALDDYREVFKAWRDQIERDAGLQWQREPRRPEPTRQ